MSWWTNFRDAALTGAGLKKGRNAAKTIASVARPQFKAAVAPAPQARPHAAMVPPQINSTFSIGSYVRNNKGLAAVLIAGGLMVYKEIKK